MRVLLIVVGVLFYVIFFEKDTHSYVKPFGGASVVLVALTLILGLSLNVDMEHLLLLQSSSLVSNIAMLAAYMTLTITIVAIVKAKIAGKRNSK